MARRVDRSASYVWILRHVDGWYVDSISNNGAYFRYRASQKKAMRFSNRHGASEALARLDAHVPHIPSVRHVVRVVRLKLKEKTR